ncbi:hypothetical protein QJS04_geneDACA020741 [Acorus gramineus]|uniref:Bifunctional inhibitor/plant lipid transfer protein/seed storage helical domain-containing protein n=1 Tax=Acorus gramineus TaxID=55184 RepID=A0AAV9A1U7_ACOGR|nr:hypothetical protein QJS04_geneDACA020741 [Acorus gramineus]
MATCAVKLTALAILLFVVVVVEGSIEEDNKKHWSPEDCDRELEHMHEALSTVCRPYIESGQGGTQVITMMSNDGAPKQCCQQLKKVSKKCRCELIKHLTDEVLSERRGERGGEEGEEQEERQEEQQGEQEELEPQEEQGQQVQEQEMVVKRAENLPSECGMKPRQCQIRASGGYSA